jgi:hypothetical protein
VTFGFVDRRPTTLRPRISQSPNRSPRLAAAPATNPESQLFRRSRGRFRRSTGIGANKPANANAPIMELSFRAIPC